VQREQVEQMPLTCSAKGGVAVTRRRPRGSDWVSSTPRPASRIIASAGATCFKNASPASVRLTWRVVRCNSRVFSAASSVDSRRLTVERGIPNASAAPRKLRSSATRTKSSTAPTSIVLRMGHMVPRVPELAQDI